MRYRNLGRSGLTVSELGLGCNNLGGRVDDATSCRIVDRALDEGITFFDVANVYGRRDAYPGASEAALGQALGKKRARAIIATKFGMKMSEGDDPARLHSGASRRAILHAVDESLVRLRTDWIDLYQLHEPDPLTPIEETIGTLDDLTRAGKIRYAGLSNLPAWCVADAWHHAQRASHVAIVSCQDEYSLLAQSAERELLPALRHFGLGLLPYFPLACGMLTGKYRRGVPPAAGTRLAAWTYLQERYRDERIWSFVEALEACALRHETTMTCLAFTWLLREPLVGSLIAGATSALQIEHNVAACATRASDAAMEELDRLVRGERR